MDHSAPEGRPARLAALARDALLDHLTRDDPRHALALLVSSLTSELGLACELVADALPAAAGSPASPGWTEGRHETGPHTTLELPPLGRLHVQGAHDPAALQRWLEPVLATIVGLMQRVSQPEAGAVGGAHASLLREAMAGADTFVWEWFLDNDWLTDIDQGLAMLSYNFV